MDITLRIDLPSSLTYEEEQELVGHDDPEQGKAINYGQPIMFGHIRLVASRKMMKVIGYKAFTTIDITWSTQITRAQAQSAFAAYLRHRGIEETAVRSYLIRFDNACAVDENGNFLEA
ncbi:MAG TPA: hypothetical protein VKZ53_19855 [Candidatus Angelobacter sp.]|nr:hypothetical protein [Candidatus Angelobacter sp.]